ncbi:MAG: Lateral flagellin [Rhizobacter sp.]|nr:Lateral flagellin [Rhizobacter sp.]
MLSLHTNFASLSAQSSLSRTQSALSTSQTRLSTGYRINSAADDAAGLQIATRLKAQTSGMAMAMRNTQNATSMLQTGEGAFDDVTSMLVRMKDLATEAADASSSSADQTAMQAEFDALANQMTQIMANTSFGGMNLLSGGSTAGALTTALTFQIGASASETFTLNLSAGFSTLKAALVSASSNYTSAGTAVTASGSELLSQTGANGILATLDKAINAVGTVRSALGAAANRLDHVYKNLQNMSTNTEQATSRIMDVDYASETANQTTQSMLAQAGTAMLKQSSQMSQMVLSLLQ